MGATDGSAEEMRRLPRGALCVCAPTALGVEVLVDEIADYRCANSEVEVELSTPTASWIVWTKLSTSPFALAKASIRGWWNESCFRLPESRTIAIMRPIATGFGPNLLLRPGLEQGLESRHSQSSQWRIPGKWGNAPVMILLTPHAGRIQ